MKKICKLCLMFVAILASTNAWGGKEIGGLTINDVPYYGKVSAHVSSKYSGGGKVYVHSPAGVDTVAWRTKTEQNQIYDWDVEPTVEEIVANAQEHIVDKHIHMLYGILETGSSKPVTAYLVAFPNPGYYFKGWSKVDNDYDLGAAVPLECTTLSMTIPQLVASEENPDIIWPKEEDIPSIGTFYATFRPVLVNECVDGDNLFMGTEDSEQEFEAYFSTSFASQGINDFAAPVLTNAITAGGTFALNGDCEFTIDNEVKVPLKFIPNPDIQEGIYSCQLTVASKGGSSITATIKMTVEKEPEYEASIGDSHYSTFEEALAAANTMSNAVITLAKNVDVTTAQMVYANMTIDLNGKALNGTAQQVLVVAGGKLTLVDSKKIGYISHMPSAIPAYSVLVAGGEFVMDGGSIELNSSNTPEDIDPNDVEQIKANMAVAVLVSPNTVPGVTGPASFTMNDGRIYADAPGVVGGIMNNGGTATINAGEIYSTGYMGVLAASNMPEGTLNILGGNLQAELKDDYGTATMAYGVLAFGGTINIEKAKIIAKAGDNLSDNIYGVCCSAGTTTISKKATIGIEYTRTSEEFYAHCCIGAMHVEKDVATAILDGAKLYARGNNGYTEEFSGSSAPIINAAYFPTRLWLDNINPDYFVIRDGQTIYDVSAGKEYLEGYRYFLGSAGTAKDNGNAVCKIGNMGYATLEDALFYAQNNPTENVIITMVNDYTLPAGWYTLPSNASLLVPYCAEQTALMGKNVKKLAAMDKVEITTPTPYKTLTIASGAHIDVFGSIEASCVQRIQGSGAQGCAVPDGPFGWIKMEDGSEMTLNSGSHLYAWGFVTGKGEIEARRGCTVHEDFQVYDWDGGTNALMSVMQAMLSGAGFFPINQYAIQNIECPVTYHPGSHMYASFGATAGGFQVAADEIGIVGVNEEAKEHPAMFLMNSNADADNTWVRKYYDTETDQQVYEVNSSAHLGSMVIDIPLFSTMTDGQLTGFDSKNFVLPITSNMKLHLLSGMMDITQNTEFLPGSELEVNKTSMMIVQYDQTDVSTGRVIFVDDDDWKDEFGPKTPYKQIAYSPTFNGAPNIRDIAATIEGDGHRHYDPNKRPVGDAKLNVHGTFRVDGYLLTTDSGATIFSNNEDAGTIIFPYEIIFIDRSTGVSAPTDAMIEQIKQMIDPLPDTDEMKKLLKNMIYVPHLNTTKKEENEKTDFVPLKSALLRNTAGQTPAFAQTGNNDNPTLPGESYCFLRDRWTKMDQFDANFAYDNYGAWYVKPGEYVAIATTAKDPEGDFKDAKVETQPLENADHTYSDANGEGRLFILVYNEDKGGDQCWEVTIQDNLYRGTNGTYYYYYEDKDNSGWMEKTFSVTWNNYDGSFIEEYSDIYYGTTPKYNGKNPSREEDEDYTYTFTGWTPEIVPVHEDAIYTATYERSPRKYTIIFEAENGEEIERHFYTKGEMPECEDVPHKVGYYLQWEPSLGAVKGDATYRATFLPEKPTEFEVTFVNYNGDELQKGNVAVGTTPEYINVDPTKPATDEYTYEFAGWSPELKPVDAAITYTATFNEVGKTYAIRFLDENGAELQSEMLAYGVVPTAPEYSKPADAEFTYTLVWSPTITAVNNNQDYKATFETTTNKYTVTVNATGCVVEGAGAYDYGTEVTLHIAGALEGYENAQWEDGTTDDKVITVTGNATYTATATPIADKTLVVEDGDLLTLTEETRVAAFTIQANSETSGQIINADQYLELTGAGKAYFEYDFNAQAMKWYAFAVPFVCDANTLRNATRTLTPGVDYDIMEYNGATRAAAGADDSAWEYISEKGINVLTPGHLYMILFAQAQNTITFTKTASASIVYTAPVTMSQYPATEPIDANWNGVANPKLFYANLGTGVEYGQMYVGGEDRYDKVLLRTTTFPVGKSVFVQAATQSEVIVTPSVSSAPLRRMLKADKQECEISLMQGNKKCDNLSIIMNDDAEDRYVIGEDLAKAGVSTKVAQMWINRYNAKLCVNSIAAEDEVATYPLGISAPKTGAYTIVSTSVPANTAVYLTEDDNIIADLTAMPYTLDLSKGTHNEFGLRMVGKTQPSVVTDFREAGINGKEVQKVIKNNTLYILRADKVFNAQGQLVK